MYAPDRKRVKLVKEAQNGAIQPQTSSTIKDMLEPALTPERCHELREGGILELMVQLLHEHTIETHNQSAVDFNIDSFIKRFNRKSLKRKQLARQIRTIVENTAKDDSELEILGMLEGMRELVEKLYRSISDGSSQELAVPEMIDLLDFMTNEKTPLIFELFGGVFVILDHLRAQARFYAKFPAPLSLGLTSAMLELPYLIRPFHLRRDIKMLLLNGGRFYATLAGLIKEAFDHDDALRLYCKAIIRLKKDLNNERIYYANRDPHRVRAPFIRDYQLTKCLAELAINNKHPETLCYVLEAIQSYGILAMDHDHRSVLEFCSVDGSVGALIDVLVPSEEKDNDVENAKWYEKQKLHSSIILHNINGFLLGDEIDPLLAREQQLAGEKLQAIYESRSIVETLLHHLKLADPNVETDLDSFVMTVLADVLKCSDDQYNKFQEIDDAIETIERFENADHYPSATEILNLFEESMDE